MSWELKAAGIVADDVEGGFEKVEQELADELRTVLSNPKYGTHFSQLGARLFGTEVHTPAAVPAPAESQPAQE